MAGRRTHERTQFVGRLTTYDSHHHDTDRQRFSVFRLTALSALLISLLSSGAAPQLGRTPPDKGGADRGTTGSNPTYSRQQPSTAAEQRPLQESQPEKLRPILSVLRSTYSIEEAPSVVVDPSEYVLGPGDVVAVRIRGIQSEEYDLVVTPEGTLSIPGIGLVQVNDVVLGQAKERVVSEILKYRKNVEIDVYLQALRRIKVDVHGQVAQPGTLSVPPYTRVAEILCAAGGILDSGTERYIEVRREGAVIATIDLADQLVLGGRQEEPRLEGGDVIFVPYLRGRLVEITGEVWRSGAYELRDGEGIADLLALCGGVKPSGVAERATLARKVSDSARLRPIDLSQAHDAAELQDGDRIEVPALEEVQSRITVRGELVGSDKLVFPLDTEWEDPRTARERVGAYRLSEGETVADVIRECGGLTARADRKNAHILRPAQDGTYEEIPLDLTGIEEGTTEAAQVQLASGDELVINALADVVYVYGEVNKPGPVPYRSDYDLMDYIGQAGTPTIRAKMSSIVVASYKGPSPRSVKVDARTYEMAKQHLKIYPGDMIIVPEKPIARWQDVAQLVFTLRNLVRGWSP
jgi:protein involved in polysaccharide export with SLBB domain